MASSYTTTSQFPCPSKCCRCLGTPDTTYHVFREMGDRKFSTKVPICSACKTIVNRRVGIFWATSVLGGALLGVWLFISPHESHAWLGGLVLGGGLAAVIAYMASEWLEPARIHRRGGFLSFGNPDYDREFRQLNNLPPRTQ
jgi:hypothetical protein